MSERLVQYGPGPGISQGPQPLHTRESDPAVRVMRPQPPLKRGDQRRHSLGRTKLDKQPYRMQGIRDPQLIRGEGRRRPGGARVREPGQGIRRGGASRRIPVIQQQDERLEGPPVPRDAQPERGQLPRPQRLSGLGQHGRQLIRTVGHDKPLVPGRPSCLAPHTLRE